jgi:hypothetical protein
MRILGLLFFAAATLSADVNTTVYIPQVVDGGEWKTTFSISNLSTLAVGRAVLHFWNEDGTPMALPFTGVGTGSAVEITVLPKGVLILETAGTAAGLTVGWADMDVSSGNFSTMYINTIMRQRVPGRPDAEVVVPSRPSATKAQVFSFDNRAAGTGFAAMNAHRQNESVIDVTARNQDGQVLRSWVLTIPPGGHTSFELGKTAGETQLQYGTVEFAPRTGAGGYFAVIGLRFFNAVSMTNLEMMIP